MSSAIINKITDKIHKIFHGSEKFLKDFANPFFTPIFTVFNYIGARKLIEDHFEEGKKKEFLIATIVITSFAYLILYLWIAAYQVIKEKKRIFR